MNMQRLISGSIVIAAGLLLTTSPVLSGEDEKPARKAPAHSPERASPTDSDAGEKKPQTLQLDSAPAEPRDSVADDLQTIVVLCATKPQSKEFKDQWAAYVRKHYEPGMDVDSLIDAVISRANEYRNRMNKSDIVSSRQRPNDEAISKHMHDTAKAIISNMRA